MESAERSGDGRLAGSMESVRDTLQEAITFLGANAVNGVINVITKHARDTQGGLLTSGGGSEELGFGGIRYGGKADKAYYRGYAKSFGHEPEHTCVQTTGCAGIRQARST